MKVKEIFQIKLLQIFQSITRVDIYICLQLIFKNFRKLQIIMDLVKVENINCQNFGTSKQTHYAEKIVYITSKITYLPVGILDRFGQRYTDFGHI